MHALIAVATAALLALSATGAAAQDTATQQAPGTITPGTITPGTITIEPLPEAAASPGARLAFAEAAAEALADAGFQPLPGQGGARYVARLTLTRTPKGAVATVPSGEKAAVNVGDWGADLTVAMPTSKTEVRALIVTQLTIEIVRRGEEGAAWRGSALTAGAEAGPKDAPALVAKKLAGVVMRGFPQVREGAVSVP